jgi:antitoxin component of RelBE/YafQ-DinJ toxin-antitoxin module|tara:strand:- start:2258 stop:2584 length:327 start_codon:yes stop_codon:yes gene_type:complete
MKNSKSTKDLKNINAELSTILEIFVKEIAKGNSFEVASWLEKNNFKTIADIRLLQKYSQRTFQLFRKQWMEDGYEDCFRSREINNSFRKVDAELGKIIKALMDLRRRP